MDIFRVDSIGQFSPDLLLPDVRDRIGALGSENVSVRVHLFQDVQGLVLREVGLSRFREIRRTEKHFAHIFAIFLPMHYDAVFVRSD